MSNWVKAIYQRRTEQINLDTVERASPIDRAGYYTLFFTSGRSDIYRVDPTAFTNELEVVQGRAIVDVGDDSDILNKPDVS